MARISRRVKLSFIFIDIFIYKIAFWTAVLKNDIFEYLIYTMYEIPNVYKCVKDIGRESVSHRLMTFWLLLLFQ